MKIEKIRARWILDSRGNPTIETDVILRGGVFGRAAVPAGITVGITEAAELRDKSRRFGGQGVSRALNIIEHAIAPVLEGMEASHQEAIDAKMCALDGTTHKSHYGSNTILAVSLAVARAAAQANGLPFYRYVAHLAGRHQHLQLPMPMFNLINGGNHAKSSTDIQEYLIIPKSAQDIQTALRMATEIFHQLGKTLEAKAFSTGLGDEGGYALWRVTSNSQPLSWLARSSWQAGYEPNVDVVMAIDVAAAQLYHTGHYRMRCEKKELGSAALLQWYQELIKHYALYAIEDPFFAEAWSDWRNFTQLYSDKLKIIGDDLITTNDRRLHKAVQQQAANSLLIKPNQVGTLTETIHITNMAQAAGWQTIMANRAGETEDSAIAHLAVGLGVDLIKAGSVARGERTAKYNELLRISESLKSTAIKQL